MLAARQQLSKRLIESFNGLRGLAVLFVMGYHWFPMTIRGGYLGVVIFLMLSGYLVTDQFLYQVRQTGQVDVFAFYKRRVSRLYPPLIFFMLLLSTWAVFLQRGLLQGYRGGFFATLLGYNNLWQISREVAYFDQFGLPSVFTHLWTLSLEIQFYLIWPWVIFLIARFLKGRVRPIVGLVSGGLAVVSAVWMAVLYALTSNITRVYYGPDTRVSAFLMGAFLAAVFNRNRLMALPNLLPVRLRRILAGASLAVILLNLVFLPGTSGLTYFIGMTVFGLAVWIHMALSASPDTVIGQLWANPVLLFFGRRAYSFYLWQFALQVVARDLFAKTPLPTFAAWLVQVFFLVALTELTYRLVEQGQDWLGKVRLALRRPQSKQAVRVWIAAAFSLLFGIATVAALIVAPAGENEQIEEMKRRLQENAALTQAGKPGQTVNRPRQEAKPQEGAKQPQTSQAVRGDQKPETVSKGDSNRTTDPVLTAYPELALTPEQTRQASQLKLLAIGDSVLQMSAHSLQSFFPKAEFDASVSRQFAEGLALLSAHEKAGTLPEHVLYALGTNGILNEDQLDTLAERFPQVQFYFLNVVTKQPWEVDVNALLAQAVQKHDHFHLIDWHGFAKNHPEYFYDDGTHPNEAGTPFYGQYVAKSLLEQLK